MHVYILTTEYNHQLTFVQNKLSGYMNCLHLIVYTTTLIAKSRMLSCASLLSFRRHRDDNFPRRVTSLQILERIDDVVEREDFVDQWFDCLASYHLTHRIEILVVRHGGGRVVRGAQAKEVRDLARRDVPPPLEQPRGGHCRLTKEEGDTVGRGRI